MLKHRHYVYAVYTNKSFSKAAQMLYISQPALSSAVKKTEEIIGHLIFDRSSTSLKLTTAGEYYINSIEKIMMIEDEMNLNFKSLKSQREGNLTVGAASFFCANILPNLTQKFEEKYPQYEINIVEANAEDLVKCLRTGVVDIIIDVEKRDPKLFNEIIWDKEHILLAVPHSFDINKELKDYCLTFQEVESGKYLNESFPKVPLQKFKNVPFLFLKQGNDMYERAFEMCRKGDFEPNIALYLDQLLTSYYIACNGRGAAFVRSGVTESLEQSNKVLFYKIDDDLSYRDIMLYYKKTPDLFEAGLRFIEFLTNFPSTDT